MCNLYYGFQPHLLYATNARATHNTATATTGPCHGFWESNPAVQLVACGASRNHEDREGKNEGTAGHQTTFLEIGALKQDDADDFPRNRGALAACSVLAGSFLALLPSFGLMVAIGTLQDYWQYHQLS